MMNARVESFTSVATAPPDPSGPPLATLQVIDEPRMNAFDRLPPRIFPLWGCPAEPKELTVDGHVIARLQPTDAGQKTKYDPSPEMLELLCQQHGYDDDGTASDAFLIEGEAAVRHVLNAAPLPPVAGEVSLRAWRGDRDSRLRQAEAVGRAYGLAGEAIARITGRPFVARRTLLPTCSAARRLEENRTAAAEAAAREEAAAEAVRVEAARPRSAGEMAWEVIEVNAHERAFGALIEAPFKNATMLARVGDLAWFGFEQIPGWELPPVTAEGIRVFRRDETVNHLRAPQEANFYDATFAQTLRAQRGQGYDFGAIDRSRFTNKGMARAEELVAKYGKALRMPTAPNGWRGPWLLQYLIRGLLVRPDVAAGMCIRAREAGNRRDVEPDLMADALGASASLFAVRGDISAGCAFEPEPASTLHVTKRSTGKR